MSKQSKYTKSCRGQECTVRVPGVCCGDPATVIGAHLNGGGMGFKALDIHLADCCAACHSFLDGGYVQYSVDRDTRDLLHLQAVIRTQERMVKDGTLKL